MISRFMWRFFKVGKYETDGLNLVVHKGLFSHEVIPGGQIEAWTVYPEMGMDAVEIKLSNGHTKTFIDTYDDLIGSLKEIAGDKCIES